MSGPDELATHVSGVEPATKYLARGTTVGRYVVLDRLGEGGMGIVYRAFDPELDRMVALKLLHVRAKTGATIGDAAWLLREAQALARLSHPNVVAVHDVGAFTADQVFVAMELVDGATLRDWLRATTRTWREVRDVMLAAGAGLAAAHAAKLVHRDVKPENILVGSAGDGGGVGRVYVMDFGLARLRRGTTAPIVHATDSPADEPAPAHAGVRSAGHGDPAGHASNTALVHDRETDAARSRDEAAARSDRDRGDDASVAGDHDRAIARSEPEAGAIAGHEVAVPNAPIDDRAAPGVGPAADVRSAGHGDPAGQATNERPVEQRPLMAELTVVEGVIGTPAYMAPELFDGAPADARSDQFSFGVVLWEALCGQRPFAHVALVPDKTTKKPEIPATSKVPARIAAVAQRAIAIDPQQRFATMDELLVELGVDPTARRRRLGLIVAALAAIALTIGATSVVTRSGTQVCKGIAKRLAGTWDATTQHAIHDAYLATKLPFADKAYAALEPALDRYAADWVEMATESCEATRVRRDQTEEVLSLRESCLSRRLVELGSLTRLLAEPTKSVIEKADQVAFELDPLSGCADVAALREPGAPPPEIATKLAPIERQIADAKARVIAGQYLAALTASTQASKAAEAIGWLPLLAEAERTHGACLLASGNNEDAAATITKAIWDAEAAKRDDLVAFGALSLAMVTAEALGKPAEAKVWLGLGAAAAKRGGAIDPKLDVARYKVEGLVAADLGDLPGAVEAQQRAFASAEKLYRGGPVLSADEALFASTLLKAYEYAKAVPHFEHAMALRSRIVGMEHPDIALMQSNLAVAYQHLGDRRARATFEKALALRERLYGAQSPILVPTLDNFAVFLRADDDVTHALPLVERAERLAAIFPGKDNYAFHIVVTDHAEILVAAGRMAEAHAALDMALELETKSHSTALPTTQSARAELALIERAWPDAAAFATQAIAGFESAGGANNPELWRPLTQLGRATLELGKPTDARPLLERGLAIGARIHLTTAELAPARAALARVGQ